MWKLPKIFIEIGKECKFVMFKLLLLQVITMRLTMIFRMHIRIWYQLVDQNLNL